MDSPEARKLELWAGLECTVNRVGDVWHDQLARGGHGPRRDDLDLIAALGVRTIRYPVLWERVAPDGLERADFGPIDASLERAHRLGLRPIVGLLHHGSGPRNTHLLDPSFPDAFAEYAYAVARRYPWIDRYTPVNEPLTTARFSGLYGHWYPHGRDTPTFLRALVTQCRAVVLAMDAIRTVAPGAALVQTEDVGTIYATPAVAYQAAYENHRRWLSLDLLSGLVDERHPLWRHLLDSGLDAAELRWFAGRGCVPDVLGINYYVTSDRLLDDACERWPAHVHGGNGRDRYADVEAVRGWGPGIAGHRGAIDLVWQRYRRPIALTEVHLGCTREEQLRWLLEAWNAAREARAAGVDVRAVTAWSFFGTYDWSCLAVRSDGTYEPGVFDVRSGTPRPTALATAVARLACGRPYRHPVLDAPGWWRRSMRLHGAPLGPGGPPPDVTKPSKRDPLPLVILGATGTLGRAFARICERRGLTHRLLGRRDMDIADADSVARVLDALRPWAVINAAGYVRVDDADREPERCHRENALGPAVLAAACAERGARLVTFSSDLVFDGKQQRPYVESDPVRPLCVYGETKALAERDVAAILPSALIIRTSAFFGPWDRYNFVTATLAGLRAGRRIRAAADTVVSPTYVPELVDASLDLLIDDERGIWHVANDGAVTWADLARLAARAARLDAALVEDSGTAALGCTARRPPYSALGCERGRLLPTLEASLERYLAEYDPLH